MTDQSPARRQFLETIAELIGCRTVDGQGRIAYQFNADELDAFVRESATLSSPLPQALEAASEVERDAIRREARKEALSHFKHEHGQDFADAKKWREWREAQQLIEEEMPEGYTVTLQCSPGDWDLRFTDPEGEDIRIDDYESTEHFIRESVAYAKAQTKEQE